MARSVSIRFSLLRNLVVFTLLLGGGILLTTVLGTRRAVRTLSQSLIQRTLDRTEVELRRFFDPVTKELLIARSWARAGRVNTDDRGAFTDLFYPLMRSHEQISSLMVADARDREFMLLRIGNRWTTRQTRPDEWGNQTRWLEWTDAEPTPRIFWKELDYRPTRRPWYAGAIRKRQDLAGSAASTRPSNPDASARDRVHWTEPYTFFTTKDPGITASVSCEGPDGAEHVIGFDVLLNDISRFTTRLRVSEAGSVFVLTDADRRLIGLPADPRFAEAEARREALLKRPEQLGLVVAQDAMAALDRRALRSDEPVRFRSDGQAWWAQSRSFDLSPQRRLWITVMVPDADVVGALPEQRVWIVGITLGLLLGAIARAVVLARRYGQPIEALAGHSDRIRRGDLEPGRPVESDIREVRRLAEAQERMRAALRSLLKLERDLQLARQIQQDTFPDALPTVSGFDIVAWNEPADETGGDTYDVIGYRLETDGRLVPIPSGPADHAVLLLADATGHGIGPALSVTQVRAMLRMALRAQRDLATLAGHMNEQLCADLKGGRFVTAWLGEVNSEDHTLKSFSAGQGPILRYEARADRLHVLKPDAPPFGIIPDLPVSIDQPAEMKPGDICAVISDGIYEAANPEGELFGTQRVIEVISATCQKPTAQILAALQEAVESFTRGHPAGDDRTVLIVKRTRR